MKNVFLISNGESETTELQKKQLRANIRSLQRDLIKASFKQSNAPESYSELLHAINTERAKLKKMS